MSKEKRVKLTVELHWKKFCHHRGAPFIPLFGAPTTSREIMTEFG